jgi:hypothetical protein
LITVLEFLNLLGEDNPRRLKTTKCKVCCNRMFKMIFLEKARLSEGGRCIHLVFSFQAVHHYETEPKQKKINCFMCLSRV